MTNLLIRLFVKDYKNISSSKVRERYGKFASIAGIATNILLFIFKMTVGMLFNSISITADAINNLSDSGSSLITLTGFKLSGKPADEKHPYGHARMEYISGLIVSFLVLFLGFELFKSSVEKIINPQEANFNAISIMVLIVSILIKLWQSMFYRKIGRMIDSTTLMATSVDSRNDIFSTSAVLAAAIITRSTGYNLDGYMGAAVALFILFSGVKLIQETISPLLGMAPTKELVDKIYKKILSYDGIIGLHDLTVHSYGPGKCFASVHCEVSADQDIMASHDIIDNIERDFLKDEGIHMVIHLDPVVTDDERINALKAIVEDILQKISPKISMHDFRVVFGLTHSNLIFDVVVPYDFELSDDELAELISDKIHEFNRTYHSIITVDHNYVPEGNQR
ncbi:cation-efflux pump [Clostridium thermosuccinogenes]|uniref:Cation-efflux pump n=1 Tax=Clostridium thermosuccinogenes TaxID=84032 RepID=A0A2K2EY21_9CLOT|nr:cation diffusion facilitator family transporter [Pseudoclostridium thermosuccinogenes]AUS95052.1 cation-efflux pump [Pseudoclostridium thermosuccinogenes]PNT91424.1 cation-efflux pump [Pseudoclostridium thermosuccinogenes]PNT96251.1 cation-efflux pump [Pseudoclostridium thermosuccinogenes]PNT97933.1 cation-efflux pump [Pseudoclostridium thermosuccinogenes]